MSSQEIVSIEIETCGSGTCVIQDQIGMNSAEPIVRISVRDLISIEVHHKSNDRGQHGRVSPEPCP